MGACMSSPQYRFRLLVFISYLVRIPGFYILHLPSLPPPGAGHLRLAAPFSARVANDRSAVPCVARAAVGRDT